MENQWYEEELKADDQTIAELDQMCAKLAALRDEYDAIKDQAKKKNEEVEALEFSLLNSLKRLNRKNWDAPVGKIISVTRESWQIPKGEESRAAFFEYLKQEGVYDGMISVHSGTLNSYLAEKFNKAKEEGNTLDFKIPGIQEPTVTESLRFTRKR